ncbi:hypothetical protein DFJ74DRAFT_648544 [Hyaloraphidium curvatum]|nr:hypothetical protein DFJ74DRAFT_648544 [Hyaloraphidium curvatum]
MEDPLQPHLPPEILIVFMELLLSCRLRRTLLELGLASRDAWDLARALLHRTLEITDTNFEAVQRTLGIIGPGGPRFRELCLDGFRAFLANFGSPVLEAVERVSVLNYNRSTHPDLPGSLSRFPCVLIVEPGGLALIWLLAACLPRELILVRPDAVLRDRRLMGSFPFFESGRPILDLLPAARMRPADSRIVVKGLEARMHVTVEEQAAMWRRLPNTVVEEDTGR